MSNRRRPHREPSLRTTLMVGAAIIASLAFAICAALLLLADRLHASNETISASVNTVLQIEEAEINLLLLARKSDPAVKQELERALRERFALARQHIASDREGRLLDRVVATAEAYLAAARDPASSAAELATQESRAFAALEDLVNFNLAESDAAQEGARRWDRMANTFGVVTSMTLAVLVAGLIAWMRRRAFRPLFSLAATMRRFGRGDREVRAEVDGAAELREMSGNFNAMATAIAAQRQAQVAVVGGVAHDLRTPLSSLKLAVEMLSPEVPLPPEPQIRRLLALIDRQIDRMDRMVGDFLDVSKIEAGELALDSADHDVRPLVREAVAMVDGNAQRFRVSLPDHPVIVRCDPLRLEQVVANLASNAIKYSPPEASVEIEVGNLGREARIAVIDHGVGIAPADRERIFEPFQRVGATKSTIPGVGLGLFNVKRIVQAHHGRIEVASTQGDGSTFTVYLPLATITAHEGPGVVGSVR